MEPLYHCPLCREVFIKENLVVEFEHVYLLFNRYPYLPGHLLLLPKQKEGFLNKCSTNTRLQLMDLCSKVQTVLLEILGYNSCNIGINTGVDSGGSIPNHLHVHIVPRRRGDMNYMATLTRSKTVRYIDNIGLSRNKIIKAFVDNIHPEFRFTNVYIPNKHVKRALTITSKL